MGLESVGALAMHIILSKLGPPESASVACLNKGFRVWASEDSLWARFCSNELGLSSPLDPYGNPTPSFKASYQAWRDAFSMYPWPLVTRAKRCWTKLKDWLAVNFPEALPTLRRGASEDEIEDFEKSMKIKLPLPTRVLYRLCDGQELHNQHFNRGLHSSLLGIIGGYALYDHLVNVFLLPLRQVMIDTRAITRQLGVASRSKYIVVASSATYSEKLFFLNCSSGQLFVGTRNLVTDGEMLPCVPDGLISSCVHDVEEGGGIQQDALLLWLEEHARRLEGGIINVGKVGNFRGINLFPEKLPLCSTAVSYGVKILLEWSSIICLVDESFAVVASNLYYDGFIVSDHTLSHGLMDVMAFLSKAKVRASAAFVPEFSNLEDESEKYVFAYSIRLSLSPDGCIINGLKFDSCQLYWRHWIIRANDAVASDVNGEAVIGKYPLLRPGEEEFVYESCTPLQASLGSIEGSFTFVPGRLADEKGNTFAVEVARFPLQLPDYIF